MQRVGLMLVWLLALICTVGFTHFYLWHRWVKDTGLLGQSRLIATVLLCALGLLVPLSMMVGRAFEGRVAQVVWQLGLLWMGVFFISVVCVAAGDLLLFVSKMLFREQLEDIGVSRRLFLMQLYGVCTAGLAMLVSSWGFFNVRKGPRVVHVEVPLAKWPQALNGFRVVQLSDLHVGPTVSVAYVEKMVKQVMALAPDMIVLTGDFVDGSVAQLKQAIAPLANLKAKHGVYFVTGNHEFYSGVFEWVEHFKALGFRVLQNERVTIHVNENHCFDLAGAHDITLERFVENGRIDWSSFLSNRNTEQCCLLLAHQPKVLDSVAPYNVDLIFSGHTHDGQIWPFGYLVRLVQPAARGLSWFGTTAMYVNRGTGYWGPPLRVGTFSEITHMTLKKDERIL